MIELNKILQGNVVDRLKDIPDNFVDLVVTSPPYYQLRDYNIKQEVIWGGDETCNHVFGDDKIIRKNGMNQEYYQKNSIVGNNKLECGRIMNNGSYCGVCGAWKGQFGNEPDPLMYVDHSEIIYREIHRVLKPTGIFFLNIDDTYSGSNKGVVTDIKKQKQAFIFNERPKINTTIKQKSLMQIPERISIMLTDRIGFIKRANNIWHKPNPTPESVTDRTTKSFEYVYMFTKQGKYYCNMEKVKELSIDPESHKGVRKRNMPKMLEYDPFNCKYDNSKSTGKIYAKRNKRNVWSINTFAFPESHFATMPPKLARIMIRMGCPEGGIVLDPFGGSGTTAAVAIEERCNYILIELNPDYIKLAEKRIKTAQDKAKQLSLFQ